MEITKLVKPFIYRGWPNTFANIVYHYTFIYLLFSCAGSLNLNCPQGKPHPPSNCIWQHSGAAGVESANVLTQKKKKHVLISIIVFFFNIKDI